MPCPNHFHVRFDTNTDAPFVNRKFDDGLARDVFMRTPQENKPGTSTEDRRFMENMENGMIKDENGSWEAPLPFRQEVRELPSWFGPSFPLGRLQRDEGRKFSA